jgi:hypothetical protein
VSVFEGNRTGITVLLPPVSDGRHSLSLEWASDGECHTGLLVCDAIRLRSQGPCRDGERAGSVLESSAFDVRRLSRTTASEVPPEVVFSAHLYHDAAMAVVKEGRVVAVLELERIFQVRYFEWVQDREHEVNEEGRLALHSQLDVSIGALRAIAAKEIPRGTIFDLAVTTHCPQPCVHQTGPCLLPAWQQVWSYMWRCLLGYTLMSQLLPVREWRYAEHHRSHAALGFYDSPYALDVQRTPHTELSVCSSWGVLTGLAPPTRSLLIGSLRQWFCHSTAEATTEP